MTSWRPSHIQSHATTGAVCPRNISSFGDSTRSKKNQEILRTPSKVITIISHLLNGMYKQNSSWNLCGTPRKQTQFSATPLTLSVDTDSVPLNRREMKETSPNCHVQ